MTVLVVLAAVAGIVAGAAVGLAARAVRRRRDERLQVVPGVPSPAPVEWAGAHSPEARLHRRLGESVRSMRTLAALGSGAWAVQRHAFDEEALRIEQHLIAAAAVSTPDRAEHIGAVAVLVDRYDEAVAELLLAGRSESNLDSVVADIRTRLAALEAARREVDRVDPS